MISLDGAGWGVAFVLSMNEDGSYQFYIFSNEGVGNLAKPYNSFPLNLPDELSLDSVWEAVVLKDGTVLRANNTVYYVIAGGGVTAFGPYFGQISSSRIQTFRFCAIFSMVSIFRPPPTWIIYPLSGLTRST